mmetsp:Transcript_21206/g.58897  ORF Transcript_21206/g.58897 Transcript_21206/m.58897 type:complete len:271 (-) Transcript_21206:231-1043(-)|eukprot:CAMPEP_0117654680 /NCGR_PEP_ID=MMETSP0804-20121206/3875_1 /TAXON_ID=1074897 /ORGANISM="Tetraselmis astigmatica, Strain CCMP880" /LENGTH=270 /DNA_ID=CAMNT_0005460981 /DNA_START=191 /DNA_END=1003 /DNA_ORIENTATION=-
MALVPYSYQRAFSVELFADSCSIQIGCHMLHISQDHRGSGGQQPRGRTEGSDDMPESAQGEDPEAPLQNVGLRVWQCAFVLTEYLIRRPPFSQWAGVKVLDLGSGTGVTGICLAKAGADVVLTDLEHITPLTQRNVEANCQALLSGRANVKEYRWGEPPECLGFQPDVITAADCVYQPEHYDALVSSICRCSGAHTLTYLAYRRRGRHEDSFIDLLASRNLHIQEISQDSLHDEFRDGNYIIICISNLDAPRNSSSNVELPGKERHAVCI